MDNPQIIKLNGEIDAIVTLIASEKVKLRTAEGDEAEDLRYYVGCLIGERKVIVEDRSSLHRALAPAQG